jgi:hypothetical protein
LAFQKQYTMARIKDCFVLILVPKNDKMASFQVAAQSFHHKLLLALMVVKHLHSLSTQAHLPPHARLDAERCAKGYFSALLLVSIVLAMARVLISGTRSTRIAHKTQLTPAMLGAVVVLRPLQRNAQLYQAVSLAQVQNSVQSRQHLRYLRPLHRHHYQP